MDEKKSHQGSSCNCEGVCGCGMLDKLPPRLAFWAGVVVTAGLLFGVGFILMLVMMFKGIDFGATTSKTTKTTTANANVAVVDDVADVAAAQPAGKIDPESLRNVRGEGDYTIVEYSDTECPFCKRFHATMQQVLTDYDGQFRWAYKQFPIPSLHSKAPREANATECAAEQGKFWEYLDLMMERTTSNDTLPDEELFTMADDLGLDRAAFDSCVEDNKYQNIVSADSAEAQKMGANGTPYSVIIDQDGNVVDVISGALPYESIATTLDAIVQ